MPNVFRREQGLAIDAQTMTPALYQIIFTGEFDENTGAFYPGHGIVCGVDSPGCR